jgi:putative chitinase
MQIQNAQKRLGLAPDGVLGPKTWAALFAHEGARATDASAFASVMATDGSDIDQPLEICHFLAQAGHETQGFRYLTELGGQAYCARYDGRHDLGNTRPGDGYRFRGRGIFQNTGRGNYLKLSGKLSVDLIAHPELLAQPGYAVRAALEFWRSRGLGALALADNVVAITHKINGGTNGLSDREMRLLRLKALFS